MGRQRQHNEDCFATYVAEPGSRSAMDGLLLVADGMGGEAGGAEASQMAVDRVLEELRTASSRFSAGYASRQQVAETIRRVIRETSDRIFQVGKDDPAVRGLGSTLVLAAFRDGEALVAHVGDSRCYRIRRDKIECLTDDHTWVTDRVEAGEITADEAKDHPQKGVLLRALGDAVSPGVDVWAGDIEDDDLFILCSDGMYNAFSDGDILRIALRFTDPRDLAEALVALASDKDGTDNATAVVCRCRDAAKLEPEETEPIYLPSADAGRADSRRRVWPWLAAAMFLVLLLAVAVPRYFAVRAFERGMTHAAAGKYLHARQEFATAISLGLDRQRADELMSSLVKLATERARGEALGEPAASEPTEKH